MLRTQLYIPWIRGELIILPRKDYCGRNKALSGYTDTTRIGHRFYSLPYSYSRTKSEILAILL